MKVPKNIFGILTEYVEDIKRSTQFTWIILFGSYAKGSFGRESDIDIAVFLPDSSGIQLLQTFKTLYNLSLKYDADIQPQVFYDEEYRNPMGIVEEIVSFGIDITSLGGKMQKAGVSRCRRPILN